MLGMGRSEFLFLPPTTAVLNELAMPGPWRELA